MNELIPVALNGAYTEVHPTALTEHRRLGWRECEKRDQPEEEKRRTIGIKKSEQEAKS